MSDIFISYSSKDREKAEQLTELLASAGLSVWIDHSGIDAATSWSGEIVDAIEGCKAFVVLLSSNSIESVNVVKEVSLAAEQKKKILPLDLEPVELPRDLKYHLAGIQRSPMTNIDAIIRALGKLGLEATQAPKLTLVKETDGRKSLMILPFEDLSPTADNEWFTNGIVSELIQSLSNVKALKVMDAQTTKEFKSYKGHLTIYAKEMGIRYFVQGDVRKFGDQIKINSRLLDIETGDHLWQDSLKGTMEDIFDIQETVAKKVVEGLAVILTKDEEKKLDKKPTENAEAYEMYLKGNEYYARQTKSDYERALSLHESAVRLDPSFAGAYASIANTCQSIYRTYGGSPNLLDRASEATEKVRELEGETAQYYWVMSLITLRRGDAKGALQYARRSVETDPKSSGGYTALGFAYEALGMKEETVKAREEDVRLMENDRNDHFSLLISLHELGDKERLRIAADRAIPIYERYIRLNPDDYHARVHFTSILLWSDNTTSALEAADELSAIETLDGTALYNLACLYLTCNAPDRGMEHLRRAVAKGFRNIEQFRRDPDLDPLRGTPEFEELMKEVESSSAK
ncbi:MAG: TIR domain-containing protein [Ignavibacteriota bacterium]